MPAGIVAMISSQAIRSCTRLDLRRCRSTVTARARIATQSRQKNTQQRERGRDVQHHDEREVRRLALRLVADGASPSCRRSSAASGPRARGSTPGTARSRPGRPDDDGLEVGEVMHEVTVSRAGSQVQARPLLRVARRALAAAPAAASLELRPGGHLLREQRRPGCRGTGPRASRPAAPARSAAPRRTGTSSPVNGRVSRASSSRSSGARPLASSWIELSWISRSRTRLASSSGAAAPPRAAA